MVLVLFGHLIARRMCSVVLILQRMAIGARPVLVSLQSQAVPNFPLLVALLIDALAIWVQCLVVTYRVCLKLELPL